VEVLTSCFLAINDGKPGLSVPESRYTPLSGAEFPHFRPFPNLVKSPQPLFLATGWTRLEPSENTPLHSVI
jgi:hypothetical protein